MSGEKTNRKRRKRMMREKSEKDVEGRKDI